MHVMAVANQLRRHLFPGEDGPGHAWRAVRHRGHSVEQVGRVLGARVDGRHRIFEGRAGMAERHSVTGCDEIAHEIETAWQFRSERHDTDVGTRACNHVEDVARREACPHAEPVPEPADTRQAAPRRMRH